LADVSAVMWTNCPSGIPLEMCLDKQHNLLRSFGRATNIPPDKLRVLVDTALDRHDVRVVGDSLKYIDVGASNGIPSENPAFIGPATIPAGGLSGGIRPLAEIGASIGSVFSGLF
jgi:hypothetical protein